MLSSLPHFVRCLLLLVAALSISGVASASEADDQFAVAAGHYDRGRWKLAAEEFRAFTDKYPQDRRANQAVFFLGEALLQMGKLEEARAEFQKYANREPEGRYARATLFRYAEAAYLGGKYDAAKPDLQKFLQKYPNDRLNGFVLPYLGDIALAGNDPASAVDYFRDALKRFPDGSLQDDCRVGLARALEKTHQAEEAEQLYRAVAAKSSSNLADAAQFHLGALQYNAGRYDEALGSFAAFDKRFANSAWLPNARLGRGLTLLKLNRPKEAVEQFDAVLSSKATGPALSQQALRGKVQAAMQAKDYPTVDQVVADFGQRYPSSPLGKDLRRLLARSLIERKQYEGAIPLLESLLQVDGTGAVSLENRYLLALSYEGAKRPQEAIAALLPVVDNASGQLKTDAQLVLGSLLLGMKKYGEAVAPLEGALAGNLAGDSEVKALGELAISYARAGQIDQAKKVYDRLVQKYPAHPLLAPTTETLSEAAYDAKDTAWSSELSSRLAVGGASEYAIKGKLGLGWSQYQGGKLAEAATTFEQVLRQNPPAAVGVEAAFARGQILEKLGQTEPALEAYQLIIQRYPETKQLTDAIAAAAQLSEKLGRDDEAATLYEQLRKQGPDHRYWVDATSRLAQRAFEAKQYERAVALADEVLHAKPIDQLREYALYLRGQAAVAQAEWPKAREAFARFLQELPQSPRRRVAEFWIAEADYRQGDLATAQSRLEKLLPQLASPRESWMAIVPLRLAQIHAQQKQWNEAYAIASRIEKDYPNFDQQYEVDYLLGRCLADQADFEGARKAYDRVIRSPQGAKTETAAMAQWMIGETYFHQKNYEAAYRAYLKVDILYAYPTWQAAALLEAAKCHELLGEPRAAEELYRRIVQKHPKTNFADQAAQRLANLEKTKAPNGATKGT